jgi:hypothetical protein
VKVEDRLWSTWNLVCLFCSKHSLHAHEQFFYEHMESTSRFLYQHRTNCIYRLFADVWRILFRRKKEGVNRGKRCTFGISSALSNTENTAKGGQRMILTAPSLKTKNLSKAQKVEVQTTSQAVANYLCKQKDPKQSFDNRYGVPDLPAKKLCLSSRDSSQIREVAEKSSHVRRQDPPNERETASLQSSTSSFHAAPRNLGGMNATRQMRAANPSKYGPLPLVKSAGPSETNLRDKKIEDWSSEMNLLTPAHARAERDVTSRATPQAGKTSSPSNFFTFRQTVSSASRAGHRSYGMRTAMVPLGKSAFSGNPYPPVPKVMTRSTKSEPTITQPSRSEPIDLTLESDDEDVKPKPRDKAKAKIELNAPTRQDVLDLTGSELTGVDVADVDRGEMLDTAIFWQDKSLVRNNPKLCVFLQHLMVGTHEAVLAEINYNDEDDEEDAESEDKQKEEVSVDKIMATVHARGLGSYALTAADLKCLTQDEWLNDEVINAYLCLLTIRNKAYQEAEASMQVKSEGTDQSHATAKKEEGDKEQADAGSASKRCSRRAKHKDEGSCSEMEMQDDDDHGDDHDDDDKPATAAATAMEEDKKYNDSEVDNGDVEHAGYSTRNSRRKRAEAENEKSGAQTPARKALQKGSRNTANGGESMHVDCDGQDDAQWKTSRDASYQGYVPHEQDDEEEEGSDSDAIDGVEKAGSSNRAKSARSKHDNDQRHDSQDSCRGDSLGDSQESAEIDDLSRIKSRAKAGAFSSALGSRNGSLATHAKDKRQDSQQEDVDSDAESESEVAGPVTRRQSQGGGKAAQKVSEDLDTDSQAHEDSDEEGNRGYAEPRRTRRSAAQERGAGGKEQEDEEDSERDEPSVCPQTRARSKQPAELEGNEPCRLTKRNKRKAEEETDRHTGGHEVHVIDDDDDDEEGESSSSVGHLSPLNFFKDEKRTRPK